MNPCRPAHLIAQNEEVAKQMTKKLEDSQIPLDLEVVEKTAAEDVIAAREEALAKKLEEMKKRKRNQWIRCNSKCRFRRKISPAIYLPSDGNALRPVISNFKR